ncbi:MAG: aminomethyl-transferring glycine dehydrogenase subunit GcvPA [Gammaproteobacteria bacterium]
MPFIPHSDTDTQAMLEAIGVKNIETLFEEIPADLRKTEMEVIPDGMNELEVSRLLSETFKQNQRGLCFIGAGAYEHHIPAAVWDIASRGEFLTAYTPYQAEASQGTLQLLYEYQSMIAHLTGMEVANASMYDGASALAEAVLMAIRVNRKVKSPRVLLAGTIHPHYRQTVNSIVRNQQIELLELAYCTDSGTTVQAALKRYEDQEIAALVIQQPNFFGCLEDVDALTDWARQQGAIVIACVNPTSLAYLKPPGQWGQQGVDIVCGEGQPLGVPLACGGPYFGFLCGRQAQVRQMPGRIVGRTVDSEGKTGYTLTLQAREQHIRRSKATSNICTNQGLLVTAATIYMSLLGAEGLQRVAKSCHANTQQLVGLLTQIKGVELIFKSPFFHEALLRLNQPVEDVLSALSNKGIQGGIALKADHPELGDALLICATETKTPADLQAYATALTDIMQ